MTCLAKVLYVLCVWVVNCGSKHLPPVVLVPGVGGSRLEAKLDKVSTVHFLCEKTTSNFYTLWFSIEFMVPLANQCWLDNIKLVYDNSTKLTKDQPGVRVRVPGFGDPRYVEWLDEKEHLVGYFKDIGNALVDIGYIRNFSLRGAPYDFRKGPNESGDFFINLKHLVEDTYIINGHRKVVFIAHSMGAPMVMIFLRFQTRSWKDKYVNSVISLNGVYAGSVKALKSYVVGDDLNQFFAPLSILKELQITSPSLSLLMPRSEIWKNRHLAVTPTKNYSMENIREFFLDIGYETGWHMLLDQSRFFSLEAPGTEIHCLYGTGIPTINRVVYKNLKDFPSSPDFEYGEGDGTVNEESLVLCSRWEGNQKQKVHVQRFPNLGHSQILSDKRTLSYILDVLSRTSP